MAQTVSTPTSEPTTAEKKSNSKSALEKISEYLHRGIRSGRFAPGQHLLESDLTRQLGCSRGSLRPAMIHLAADGIITLSRFKGARISVLSRKAIYDLLDVLEVLMTFTALKACGNMDTDNHRQLVEESIKVLKTSKNTGDNVEYLQNRQDFYDALITASGNTEVKQVIPLMRADLLRVQLQTMKGDLSRKDHIEGYELIAKALVEGSHAKAEKAVHKHYQRARDLVASIPDSAFPQEAQ